MLLKDQQDKDCYACDFCGKVRTHVEVMIAGPNGAAICNECVKLSAEMIADRVKADAAQSVQEVA
jgi:ATP-dependent Clp protease ATP-binding subunit ClpX